MAPAIPDRWKEYKPVGQKIEGTRFIAFKVPLKEHIAETVESDIRLDGKILLKSIPNLGLIIDLTNTSRYYNPSFFIDMGVEYKKLMIPGHDTPDKALVDKFSKLVKKFLKANPDNDKLVGVHCTHGVNRTGYMICNYMITKMNIEPDEAISRFASARGHKIERINYINALLGRNELKSNEVQRGDEYGSSRISAERYHRRSITNSIEVKRRDGYGNRRISPERYHRRIRSEANRRDGYDSGRRSLNNYHKRDGYDSSNRRGSNKRSPYGGNERTKSSQHYHYRGNYNKYHYSDKRNY